MVHVAHPYVTTGKTTALTIWTFVGKVMSLLFNMLSRLVTAFLQRSRRLLISWLLSPSAAILEPKKMGRVSWIIQVSSVSSRGSLYVEEVRKRDEKRVRDGNMRRDQPSTAAF